MEQKLLNGIDKLDDDAVVDALRWGASISALKKSTICRLANSFGTAKLLERLLAHKADVRHHDRGFSPLHHACAAPDNIAVLLRHRADVSCKDPEKGETPLMICARHNDTASLQLLLDAGARIDTRNDRGLNALMIASSLGNLESVDLLLPSHTQAQLDCATVDEGFTALMLACVDSLAPVVARLAKAGANMEQLDYYGGNALSWAVSTESAECVFELLHEKADPNFMLSRNDQLCSLLHLACQSGNEPVVELLLESSADPNRTSTPCIYPMHVAAYMGNVGICRALLHANANIHARDGFQFTPVMVCAHRGELDCIQFLLEQNADYHDRSPTGYDCLLLAINEAKLAMTEFLLQIGANIEQVCEVGTPMVVAASLDGPGVAIQFCKLLLSYNVRMHHNVLLAAVRCANFELITFLCAENHTDINMCEMDGRTPLMAAVEMNNAPLVDHLLDLGAVVHMSTRINETALTIAVENGFIDVVASLLRKKPNPTWHANITPLEMAVERNDLAIARLLLESGASPSYTCRGATPLAVASQFDSPELCRLLLQFRADPNRGLADNLGGTALHTAAHWNAASVIQTLLEHNASTITLDGSNQTPLKVALRLEHSNAVRVLLAHEGVPSALVDALIDEHLFNFVAVPLPVAHMAVGEGAPGSFAITFHNGAALLVYIDVNRQIIQVPFKAAPNGAFCLGSADATFESLVATMRSVPVLAHHTSLTTFLPLMQMMRREGFAINFMDGSMSVPPGKYGFALWPCRDNPDTAVDLFTTVGTYKIIYDRHNGFCIPNDPLKGEIEHHRTVFDLLVRQPELAAHTQLIQIRRHRLAVHRAMVEFAIAIAPLQLPPYVALHLFEMGVASGRFLCPPAQLEQRQSLRPLGNRESDSFRYNAVALWNFEPSADDELRFDAGDILEIVNPDGDWLFSCKVDTGQAGHVPNNYIEPLADTVDPALFHKCAQLYLTHRAKILVFILVKAAHDKREAAKQME